MSFSPQLRRRVQFRFFLLLAARVRSSCEEGPEMYQLLQWACTKHSVHGRTELYRTNWTVAHGELFHRRQGLLLDYSGMKELLPDSSLSHLDYESSIYDNGLCGTSMSGICYIIAEQY